MLSSDAGGAAADVLVVGLLQAVMAQIGGAGPAWSGCRSSLRPAVWAWSGAVATRGANQAGDHADGAGVRQLSGRARLRPECSRRPGTVERADLAVAQPVVDQCEQFACRGNLDYGPRGPQHRKGAQNLITRVTRQVRT